MGEQDTKQKYARYSSAKVLKEKLKEVKCYAEGCKEKVVNVMVAWHLQESAYSSRNYNIQQRLPPDTLAGACEKHSKQLIQEGLERKLAPSRKKNTTERVSQFGELIRKNKDYKIKLCF